MSESKDVLRIFCKYMLVNPKTKFLISAENTMTEEEYKKLRKELER